MTARDGGQMALGVFFSLMLIPAWHCFNVGAKSDAIMLSLPIFLHIFRKSLLRRTYATQVTACRELSDPFQLDVWRYQFRVARLCTRRWSPLAFAALGAFSAMKF